MAESTGVLWTTAVPVPARVRQDVLRFSAAEGGRVAGLPAPEAARLARPRWLDPRLVAGLVLVLLSVVVGSKILADADERVRVWSVTRDLGPDTRLSSDDVAARAVRLDSVAGRYVSADQDLEGLVLTRPVGSGELLPLGAVARSAGSDQRRVVVEVDRTGAGGLDKGRVVDVYAVREDAAGGSPAPPVLVLSGVTVAEDVKSAGGTFGGSGSTAGVALLVDGDDVAGLIDAMAHGDVYVVQVPTTAGATGSSPASAVGG
jgi:hypothetical protein